MRHGSTIRDIDSLSNHSLRLSKRLFPLRPNPLLQFKTKTEPISWDVPRPFDGNCIKTTIAMRAVTTRSATINRLTPLPQVANRSSSISDRSDYEANRTTAKVTAL